MVHSGLCVARTDGGDTVLVAGAIPGELVDVEVRRRRSKTWFADTTHVLEASPQRVEPPCPYVPACGGCQLQHVAYPHQLELKRDIVLDALRRQRVDVAIEPHVIGMADPWRYRWRGEFHVVPGAQGIGDAGLGFNRARSRRPIAVDDCLIHHPLITESLPVLRELVHEGGSDELGTLHLTVGDDGRELLLRGRPRRALDEAAIDRAALRLPRDARLSVDSTSLTWRGRTYRVSPESFMQVNVAQMDALYQVVLDALRDVAQERIVDAYAGIGLLAVELAAGGADVVCIESNRSAARLGVLNARLNDVAERVHYVVAPAEETLARSATNAAALVVDPPRAGCESGVTAWIALAGPPLVVYVSCDPATLARDLHVLAASGPYAITGLTVVDMFPQTYHVETVVTLQRAETPLGGASI